IVEQACEGLHYAHRNGVVHRDVKPGNLLRAREGEVKLADFGIAKATEQSSITQVGSVLGTAAYLAPEQARGGEAGPSADLYARAHPCHPGRHATAAAPGPAAAAAAGRRPGGGARATTAPARLERALARAAVAAGAARAGARDHRRGPDHRARADAGGAAQRR